jgi:hypothetical protein
VQDVLGVFATRAGMVREGKVDRSRFSKTLQLAVTVKTLIKHGGYSAHPSMLMQKFIGGTLGTLAEALGDKAVYPQYVNGG